jgi:hypothetical protein
MSAAQAVLDGRAAEGWQRAADLPLRFRGIGRGWRRMANTSFHFTLIRIVGSPRLAARL